MAGGRRRLKPKDGNADKVSSNVASPASAPPPARSPTCQRRLGQEDASDRAVAIPLTLPFAWIFHPSAASRSFLLWPRSRAWPLLSPIVPRKQNGGGSVPVRAHPSSPLRGPLVPGLGPAPGGCARTVVLSPVPGPLTFPQPELLSVALAPRTRARV